MARLLVFSERDDIAFELLGKANLMAADLGLEVAAAALGSANAGSLAERGAKKVYAAKSDALNQIEASAYAEALAQVAKQAEASVIFVGSTKRGKEIAGRLAQKLGAGCITDVSKAEVKDGQIVCSRNAYGGATVAEQAVKTEIQIIALMPNNFEPAAAGSSSGEIIEAAVEVKPSRLKVVDKTDKTKGSADIEGAEVLVCIGKGLAKQEDLAMIEELAAALGAVVACSKPVATDEKWLSEDRIIGLSGKSSKPQLAVVLGISGQVQFTVGIRDARTIVAVNSDQNAYIFQMADYGIVGDIYQVVPQLTKAIKG